MGAVSLLLVSAHPSFRMILVAGTGWHSSLPLLNGTQLVLCPGLAMVLLDPGQFPFETSPDFSLSFPIQSARAALSIQWNPIRD